MKEITIDNKKYKIDCNAFNICQYRKFFDKDLFEDLKSIQIFLTSQVLLISDIKEQNKNITDEELKQYLSKSISKDVGDVILCASRLAYIFIYTANENFENYENWLKNIHITSNDDWIVEVTEFAVDNFC